jgi:hypothetical protein
VGKFGELPALGVVCNDSPQPETENGIVWKCMQELGISCEVEEG